MSTRHSFELRLSQEDAKQAIKEYIQNNLIQQEYEILDIEYKRGRNKDDSTFVATVVAPKEKGAGEAP